MLPALLALASLASLAALIALFPWRIAASVRALGTSKSVSLAGGVEVAVVSVSVAAVWNGPAVLAVHLLGRSLWKKTTTVEALLSALSTPPPATATAAPSRGSRLVGWLVERTDLLELPDLARRLLGRLWSPHLRAGLLFGSSDPALTGRAAAWLSVIGRLLAPIGNIDADIDWSGSDKLDLSADLSFRCPPASLAWETGRFACLHIRWLGPARSAEAA